MKILAFFVVSYICFANGNILGNVPWDKQYEFKSLELNPNKPIENNRTLIRAELSDATGSIGADTLSSLQGLEMLEITKSKIDHIEAGALCSLPTLLHLTLDSNRQFPVLTESLLSNCDKIRDVFLDTEMEPNALKHMVSLESIRLFDRPNFNLTREFLEPFKKLRNLAIVNCKIKHVDPVSLCLSPKLEVMELNNYEFPPLTKSMFENCSNVKKLTVDNSHQQTEEDPFTGFGNVEEATIYSVNIPHLTKKYLTGLQNAEHLEIDYCKILEVDSDTFDGFTHLEYLELESNRLSKFNTNVELNRLKFLSLRGNRFTELDSATLSHFPNLETLDVSFNLLTSIDDIRHPNLTELRVNGNNISHVDVKALKQNLPKLKTLNIAENPIQNVDGLREDLKEIQITA